MATFVVAKESDGGVQITFTIPYSEIKKAQDQTIAEMAKDIEVAGFRKGKAPLSEVAKKISPQVLIEHSLGHILPKVLAEAIAKEKLKIAIYPRYELISSEEEKDWQVRALTCEVPEIDLGTYKTSTKGLLKEGLIVLPGKDAPKEKTREEKEQMVLGHMIKAVKVTIPKVLLDEEVNARLSSLLSRIEKLGLSLEGYLASIGKTPESIRDEYANQSRDALSLEFILTRIAEEEGLKPKEKEVEEAMKVLENSDKESQKRMVESILRRRLALDFLINLAS